jgi:hypothetical protein
LEKVDFFVNKEKEKLIGFLKPGEVVQADKSTSSVMQPVNVSVQNKHIYIFSLLG